MEEYIKIKDFNDICLVCFLQIKKEMDKIGK